jgi:hypothetical protein
MIHPVRAALFGLCILLCAQPAIADSYTIAIGEPPVGSSLPPGRVGLGIRVDVDKKWEQLTPEEKICWRNYTELDQPDVTPPFPAPNIRGLLRKLQVPAGYDFAERLVTEVELLLIVRISEKGIVTAVDVQETGQKGATTLNLNESVLVYRFVKALMATPFSPALLNGTPVASAFPMRVSETILMR